MNGRWIGLVMLLTGLSSVSARGAVPFILPWDDALPGVVTDFSSMNDPIGLSSRVAVDANGHFSVDRKRIRFLGVNFAGQLPFTPTNKSEAVAARLAKFGINCVRFHHMDASWAYGGGILAYTSTKSTNVSASQLEKLHFVVSRLKAHGIYSDINLLVGREYRSGDGLGSAVTSMDWKDSHILGYFNDTALELQKNYATKLLTPTNKFTGLPLAQDPAVAFVEIINENGIIQKWLDGGLDRLPGAYAPQLQARWNDWLAARYADEAAMLAAWNVIDQPLGANLIRNGAFNSGLSPWNTEQHETARATSSRTYDFTGGAPSARILVTQTGSQSWHIQFNQAGLRVTNGQPYTISFWAKSSPATNLDVSVMQAHADWLGVGYSQGFTLTTNWQEFSTSFQATATDSNVRVNFGGMGLSLATFWFADVRLQPGGRVGMLPPGASLESRTVPNIRFSGSGYTGTAEARKDWLRFLRDLETRYYDQMVAHLRGTCGYPGLIFGTIMANSPATVQSQLDVIDGHAYWQHPQFPGVAWDMSNWFLPNISLVNTLGNDNSLAGLARQRIKGKPFTVTEYNHPQPNYYGAEGPLLLGACAALQDWDGVWLFDYGHGQDGSTTMGYAQGFFDIAQHPGKMANLLLAANIFRRGDVLPGAEEITMALTPDTEIDLLANAWAWSVFSSSQLGVAGKLAFVSRLGTSVGTNATGLTTPPTAPTGNVIVSDTGQFKWDLASAGRGVVTVNAQRSKAVIGCATNRTFTLGDVTLEVGAAQLGWCTFGATLTRGDSFTNNCTALVAASGWWENTGQVWKDANKDSVTQFGRPPVLTEVVPFTLTLPVAASRVTFWALDERGQRIAALPVTGTDTTATLAVTTNAATIWYEIEVARFLTSFDAWRASNFTAAELADPGVSGEAATPARDGVPNLVKYYLGLVAKTPAAAERLPRARLLESANRLHLAIDYLRDPAAAGVFCLVEVSPDLRDWFSGPAYTAEEPPQPADGLERCTVWDLTPVETAAQRFMRLRLSRAGI